MPFGLPPKKKKYNFCGKSKAIPSHQKHINRFFEYAEEKKALLKEIFENQGVPSEFMMKTLVESRYFSKANKPIEVSPANAVGPFQFIASTAKYYGLTVYPLKNKKVDPRDERRNLEKSAHAAAKYFKALMKKFPQDYKLTLAAYNMGEGNLAKKLKSLEALSKDLDFWTLYEFNKLPCETKKHVPKMVSSIFISRTQKNQ